MRREKATVKMQVSEIRLRVIIYFYQSLYQSCVRFTMTFIQTPYNQTHEPVINARTTTVTVEFHQCTIYLPEWGRMSLSNAVSFVKIWL